MRLGLTQLRDLVNGRAVKFYELPNGQRLLKRSDLDAFIERQVREVLDVKQAIEQVYAQRRLKNAQRKRAPSSQ